MIQTVLIHCGSVHLKLGTIWKEVPFNIIAIITAIKTPQLEHKEQLIPTFSI